MFYCAFPSNPQKTDAPIVHSLQLGKPVIDFTVDEAGRIWTLVDGERETDLPVTQNVVRLLSWSAGQVRA
jgi:tRNA (guanine-N(7)-)-methyltransferase subunit TRM82